MNMNPYLRASLLCFAFSGLMLWLFLTVSCGTYTAMGVCRHSATYAISVVGEKFPVRVAGGFLGQRELLFSHAQAQVWMDGEWKWLCVDFPAVYTCARNPDFTPQLYYVPWVWLQYYVIPNMVAN